MAFPESTKLNVKKRADFTCCWCRDGRNKVEVHHIIPQAKGGSDDEDNAAPLCGSCHDLYGGNPDLRKEIRLRRDQWYEICSRKLGSEYERPIDSDVPEIRDVMNRATTPNAQAVLQRESPYKADIRLEVVQQDFRPSPGRGVSSYRGGYREARKRQRESPAGFNKQGLPNEGHLHASIEIANVGREIGLLEWEYDEAKTKLPPLFDYDHEETLINFFPPRSIAGRNPPHIAHFDLYVPFTKQNRRAFVQAVKALIESNARYKIVIRYWTKSVEGKSEPRKLPIEGDFQDFYQKVLEYWDDFSRFRDLADLARLTKS